MGHGYGDKVLSAKVTLKLFIAAGLSKQSSSARECDRDLQSGVTVEVVSPQVQEVDTTGGKAPGAAGLANALYNNTGNDARSAHRLGRDNAQD